jgi:hypothetical protein
MNYAQRTAMRVAAGATLRSALDQNGVNRPICSQLRWRLLDCVQKVATFCAPIKHCVAS